MKRGRPRLTDGENESPPAHIKRKTSGNNNHHDSNNKPDDCEAPEDKPEHEADGIEDFAGVGGTWEGVGRGEEALDTISQWVKISGRSLSLTRNAVVYREHKSHTHNRNSTVIGTSGSCGKIRNYICSETR